MLFCSVECIHQFHSTTLTLLSKLKNFTVKKIKQKKRKCDDSGFGLFNLVRKKKTKINFKITYEAGFFSLTRSFREEDTSSV